MFPSNEQYGPDLPQWITRKNSNYISVDWFDDEKLQVVLNGDDGVGVDIFFILKRADILGYIIVLDQRKRIGSNVTDCNLTAFKSKLPNTPSFLKELNVEIVFGLMSIYSEIAIDPVPDSVFFVSVKDSLCFHGSLFDHPGCSISIEVNSSLKTSVAQIFIGNKTKRMDLADKVISQRKKKRIENLDELLPLVSQWSGELEKSAYPRIRF